MDKTVDYDSIGAMMEFTEILKKDPRKALDFMESNADRFTKEALTDILKEVLESVKYHVDNSLYEDLYENIFEDVQIELDENYDEEYQKYDVWVRA